MDVDGWLMDGRSIVGGKRVYGRRTSDGCMLGDVWMDRWMGGSSGGWEQPVEIVVMVLVVKELMVVVVVLVEVLLVGVLAPDWKSCL